MNNYLIPQIEDLIQISLHKNFQVESHFLTLEEQELVMNFLKKLPSIKWRLFGGYPQSIRKKVLIDSYEIIEEIAQTSILHIYPMAKEYSAPLTHRDFMGSILSLGLERNVIGDILVHDNEALVIIESKLAPFIQSELGKIKHTLVKVEEKEDRIIPDAFLPKFEELLGNISSQRLDLIVGWLTKSSRTKAEAYITSGFVRIGDQTILDKSKKINENTIITIKGKGKFIFQEVIGKSKKDRLIVKGVKFQ